MVVIKEFRIPLPISVEEYQVGQLYSVAEASKENTGGGEGIEVIENVPYDETRFPEYPKGQYTHKIFHLASKVPAFIRLLAPKGSLEIHEKAWNAYPYCRTEYSNPDYMKEGFKIIIITRHEPLAKKYGKVDFNTDLHKDESIFQKGSGYDEEYKKASRDDAHADVIDITEVVPASDYKEDEDPTKFKSVKTGRGPLSPGWYNNENHEPLMCCYKMYLIEFIWFGLQTKVESVIKKAVRKILHKFHRQVFCWLDKWIEMNMDDIRKLEDQTKEDLQQAIKKGEVQGMVEK